MTLHCFTLLIWTNFLRLSPFQFLRLTCYWFSLDFDFFYSSPFHLTFSTIFLEINFHCFFEFLFSFNNFICVMANDRFLDEWECYSVHINSSSSTLLLTLFIFLSIWFSPSHLSPTPICFFYWVLPFLYRLVAVSALILISLFPPTDFPWLPNLFSAVCFLWQALRFESQLHLTCFAIIWFFFHNLSLNLLFNCWFYCEFGWSDWVFHESFLHCFERKRVTVLRICMDLICRSSLALQRGLLTAN